MLLHSIRWWKPSLWDGPDLLIFHTNPLDISIWIISFRLLNMDDRDVGWYYTAPEKGPGRHKLNGGQDGHKNRILEEHHKSPAAGTLAFGPLGLIATAS